MKTRLAIGIFLLICLGIVLSLPAAYGQAHPISSLNINLQFLPLILRNAVMGGEQRNYALQGRVFNASLQDRPGLGNVSICVKGTTKCAVSDDTPGDTMGNYSLPNLPNGSYLLVAQDPGGDFYSVEATVFVNGYEDTIHDFGMVARLISGNIEMRVTVEWLNSEHWPGSDCNPGYQFGCPTDMDVHIWGKFGGGDLHYYQCPNPDDPADCKQYLGDCTAGTAMCVELFSFNGPGPETMAIRKATPGTGYTYYYAVHNFYQNWSPTTNVPKIRNTGALVRIYRLDGTLTEYQVSDAPQGDGDLWYLFSANDKLEVTLHNCITSLPIDDDPEDSILPVPECPVQ
jgi:hypothetical protein